MSRESEHRYWRSLAERDQKPGPESCPPVHPWAMDRRRFLALLGASAALGAGCGRLEERGEIVPYVDQPEGSPPGMPRLYASSLLGCPGAPPVLVTTREGRPVKLEGNPEHPASLGALDAWGQSAALSLYDPDRIRAPRTPDAEVSWEEADAAIRAVFPAGG